ncbi:MAG: chemotaxis protein CheX [Fimbriimonadales bacterium]
MNPTQILTEVRAGQVPAPLVDAGRDGVLETFGSFLGEELSCSGEVAEPTRCDGIVATISFVGTLNWSITLGFPRECAVALSERFAGFEFEFDGPEMGDVIGEIANVLAGDVSARAEACGVHSQMTLPSVTRGRLEMMLPVGMLSKKIAFESSFGAFWLRVVAAIGK